MSKVSTAFSEPIPGKAKLPWLTFVFLAVLFFVAEHHMLVSLPGNFTNPAATEAATVAEGSLSRQVAFSMFGLWGAVGLMRHRLNRLTINGSLGWLILLYLALAFLSIAWAEDIVLTFRRLVILAMFCLGTMAVTKRFSLGDILRFAFFSTGVYLIIGLSTEFALGTFRPLERGYQFSGTLHPNFQGIDCAVLLFAALFDMKTAKRNQIFFHAMAVVAFVFLILTRSRSACASCAIALLFYWNLTLFTWRKFALVLCASLTLCLALLLVGDALFPTLRQGVLLGREDATTASLSGRIPLWNQCFSYIGERPLLGYGYDAFWTPAHIFEFSAAQGWGIGGEHSAYVHLLLCQGVVGLVTYALILAIGIRRSFVLFRASGDAAYASACALLVFLLLDGLMAAEVLLPTLAGFLSVAVLAHLGYRTGRMPATLKASFGLAPNPSSRLWRPGSIC
jgi:O-antigen ligase